jgi:NTP pyrophosphatase (non-canonical NTP hydrolase)
MPSPLKPGASLADVQAYVTEMERERGFSDSTVMQVCLLLGEEVGELFKSVRKSHAGMRLASPGYDARPAEELADILIMVSAIANRLDVDLEQAFRDKEKRNEDRVWS